MHKNMGDITFYKSIQLGDDNINVYIENGVSEATADGLLDIYTKKYNNGSLINKNAPRAEIPYHFVVSNENKLLKCWKMTKLSEREVICSPNDVADNSNAEDVDSKYAIADDFHSAVMSAKNTKRRYCTPETSNMLFKSGYCGEAKLKIVDNVYCHIISLYDAHEYLRDEYNIYIEIFTGTIIGEDDASRVYWGYRIVNFDANAEDEITYNVHNTQDTYEEALERGIFDCLMELKKKG